MSFTSFSFFVLIAVCCAGYYLIPARHRHIFLLALSVVYYIAGGPVFLLYLLFAALTTYFGARVAAKGKKAAVAVPLLLDFGVLAVLKYTPLAVSLLNHLPGADFPIVQFALPLGISFYTFQSAGYLLDVYWGRCEAELSFPRYLLFVAFFPQLMQGPIGRYGSLAPQLREAHAFDIANIRRGLWRIGWGLFKKMVIADNAALYVNRIFDDYASLKSLGIEGVLMYSIQLYMDFSGGIDVALGIAEMIGIHLDENFRQPYFAQTLTDFWHRWHITLGNWMKDYLFYPISLSGWMSRLRKWSRRKLGKEIGRAFPIGVANLIIFFVVGIWHGAEWHFIVYGLYNGLIIAVSGLLTGTFRRWKKSLGITDRTRWFQAFRMLRTFVIVNISWFLDRSGSVRQAFQMFRNSFRGPIFSIHVIDPSSPSYCLSHFLPILAGCAVVLAVSIMKERGTDVLKKVSSLPSWVLAAALIGILIISAVFGNKDVGGFIYANF